MPTLSISYPARPILGFLAATFIIGWATAEDAIGGAISFSSATASYDQGYLNGLDPGAIDGDILSSGWGVNTQQTSDQTAVFITSSPVNASQLLVGMQHLSGITAHIIQRFRLSVTQDATPTIAGSWTQLTPTSFVTGNPNSSLSDFGSNTLQATGNDAENTDTYAVTAVAPFGNITGFRLEAFTDDNGTVGGSGSTGNIVLTEFQAFADVGSVEANVALDKPTSGDVYGGSWPTSNGNDDNLSNFSHGDGTLPEIWEVDLQSPFDLSLITVTSRSGSPERTNGATVTLLESDHSTVVDTFVLSGFTGGDTRSFLPGAMPWNDVQYVNVDGPVYLHVGELRAFGVIQSIVPEPSSLLLAAVGLLGLLACGRRRRRQSFI